MSVRKNFISNLILIFFILILLSFSAYYAFQGAVAFDEGFNLQVPVRLANEGEYGTDYQYGRLFDPLITTGPTLLVPIGFMFKFFGVGVVQARVVIYIYFILMVFTIVYICRQLANNWAAMLALIFIVGLPSVFFFSLKVLGEIPAIFFLLAGAISYDKKKPVLAGVFWGLMILSKIVFILVGFPLLLLAGYRFLLSRDKPNDFKFYGRLGLGGVGIISLWELYRLVSLGLGDYIQNFKDFWGYFLQSSNTNQTELANLKMHIKAFAIPFGPGKYWALFATGIVLLILVYCFWIFARKDIKRILNSVITVRVFNQDSGQSEEGVLENSLGILLVGFVFIYMVWWVSSNSTVWFRYLLVFYIIVAVLFAIAIVKSVKQSLSGVNKGRITKLANYATSTILVFIWIFLVYRLFLFQIPQMKIEIHSVYHNQSQAASFIREQAEDGMLFTYWGWYQSPELSFLSGVDFYDMQNDETLQWLIEQTEEGKNVSIIISNVQRGISPETVKYQQEFLGPQIFSQAGFDIYSFVIPSVQQ